METIYPISCERTLDTVFLKMDEDGSLLQLRCPHYNASSMADRCKLPVGYAICIQEKTHFETPRNLPAEPISVSTIPQE